MDVRGYAPGMVWQNLTREGRLATAFLVVFGAMLAPPVVYWVNTPALVAGWPVMFLWAVGWASVGVAVLAWAAWTDAFAINDAQVPPDLAEGPTDAGGDRTTGGED